MNEHTNCAGCGGALTVAEHRLDGRHPACENVDQLHERLGIPRNQSLAEYVEQRERQQAYGY